MTPIRHGNKIAAVYYTGRQSLQQHQPGDKVRLKQTKDAGARGTVLEIHENVLDVRLNETERTVRVNSNDVTNLSLAARKAWLTAPNRRVGRRKGVRIRDRVSVTLRIDRDLWQRFQALESKGLIEDRSATINQWLHEKLDRLE